MNTIYYMNTVYYIINTIYYIVDSKRHHGFEPLIACIVCAEMLVTSLNRLSIQSPVWT